MGKKVDKGGVAQNDWIKVEHKETWGGENEGATSVLTVW